MWQKRLEDRWPLAAILLQPPTAFKKHYRRQWLRTRIPQYVRTLVEQLPQAMQQLRSADTAANRAGIIIIRKMLAVDRVPPIQEVVDAGAIPYLVRFLDMDAHPQLQHDAAWALCNIAVGTSAQCQAVVDGGCVDKLVRLLRSPDANVAEKAVWALVRWSDLPHTETVGVKYLMMWVCVCVCVFLCLGILSNHRATSPLTIPPPAMPA